MYNEQQTTPKNPYRTLIISLSTALVIFVGLSTFLIIYTLTSKPPTEEKPPEGTPSQTENGIGFAQKYLTKINPFLIEANGNFTNDLLFAIPTIARFDSYEYFTSLSGFAARPLQPTEQQKDIDKRLREPKFYEKIANKLMSDGVKYTGFTFIGINGSYKLYSDDRILCNIPNLRSEDLGKDGLAHNIPDFLVSCVDVVTAKQHLDTVRPFATAFKEEIGKWPTILSGGDANDIISSEQLPFQHTTLFGINNAELFYRVAKDKPWIYFTATQGVIPCHEYKTVDLRKAFYNQTCFNVADNELSRVTLEEVPPPPEQPEPTDP